MEIIDSHSHIGFDWCWGESNIKGYEKVAEKEGIKTALLMPAPGQIDFQSGKRIILYEYNEQGFIYSSELEKTIPTVRLINEQIFNILKSYNGKLKIKFVPLIHPILENYEYLYQINELYSPIAFKIHGVATGITPKLFSNEYIYHLKKIGKPIIVHTDYLKNSNENKCIRNENSGHEWCKFFVNNDLKGYITHGARLDPRAFEIINKNENLVVGCGPDSLMINNTDRLFDELIDNQNNINILKILKEKVAVDKILFDVDYSWNVKNSKSKEMDYDGVNRVKNVFHKQSEREKILCLNAKNFFKI